MNRLTINSLKLFRNFYLKAFVAKVLKKPECDQDSDSVSKKIYDALNDDEPCMIARFGSTELTCLGNYIGVKQNNNNYFKFITGRVKRWWWEPNIMNQMQQNSGFYPPTIEKLEQFCELMLKDIPQVDILGSWIAEENDFHSYLNASKVHLRLLEPFWSKIPWTKVLEGKKILVVHPFSETIMNQYKNRKILFNDKEILPSFKSLKVIKAVQSIGEGDNRFDDWFQALEYMKSEIDKQDYDVCLIGAGAYGFSLAAHVKRSGNKSVHLGGALQLLFGIKGSRWEDPNYGVKEWGIPYASYSNLFNENWVRPNDKEKPKSANQVEGACYW